jgi:hypothetical protein
MAFGPVFEQNSRTADMERKSVFVHAASPRHATFAACAESPLKTVLLAAVRDSHFERVPDLEKGKVQSEGMNFLQVERINLRPANPQFRGIGRPPPKRLPFRTNCRRPKRQIHDRTKN